MSYSDALQQPDAHVYRIYQARRIWDEDRPRARLQLAAAARAADILAGLVSDTERERARERASILLVALAAAWDSIERDRAESVTAASLGPLLAWIGCDRRTYEDAVSAALDLFGHAA